MKKQCEGEKKGSKEKKMSGRRREKNCDRR